MKNKSTFCEGHKWTFRESHFPREVYVCPLRKAFPRRWHTNFPWEVYESPLRKRLSTTVHGPVTESSLQEELHRMQCFISRSLPPKSLYSGDFSSPHPRFHVLINIFNILSLNFNLQHLRYVYFLFFNFTCIFSFMGFFYICQEIDVLMLVYCYISI